MQVTLAFTLGRDVLNVGAISVVQQIFSVTPVEFARARTAPVVKSVTCAVRTFSTSLQRDVSKYR